MQSQQASVLPSVGPSKELSTEMKVPQSLPKIKQEKAKEAGGMPDMLYNGIYERPLSVYACSLLYIHNMHPSYAMQVPKG